MTVLARVLIVATLLALTASQSAAQKTPAQPNGEIRGRLVNPDGKVPVTGAVVYVTAIGAASPTPAPAGPDGAFRLQGLRLGRYRVRIVAIGYAVKEFASIEITAASPRADLGTIALVATPVELQSIEVAGKRPDVLLAPDRNTYVVRDMPTTRGGSALDVLRNVPAVDVDIDNIVSLRGNAGVIVQINGRPSPLKPAQLGNFLAQLPAAIVDKVEVVPNPSAREDPEGVAGIINIILKQEADAGTSGGLTIAGGTTGQANIGGNLGYQRGSLTVFGSYGFLRDRRPRNESIYRENRYLDPITYLEETGTRLQLPLAHTVTGSVGYDLGPHDELALDGIYSTRSQKDTYGIIYHDLDATRALTGVSERTTTGHGTESNLEGTLGYRHTFGKGHKLSSELRHVHELEGGPGNVVARTLTLEGAPTGTPALENQTSWERPNQSSLKLDYVRPLSPAVRLETGYKGSLQRIHTTLETEVFDPRSAGYLPDSSRINDFTHRQLVNAGYAMLVAQLGKFQVQGGVRAERATTRFHLTTSGATYDNPYTSIFPSGLVAYNVDDAHQVKLSYSSRIRRPDDPDVLDPTAHYADPLNLSRGNPYLKPEYIGALELGLQRTVNHLTMQLTPFFRHTRNAVRTIRTIDTAGVTTRTFANVATSDAYGADVTVARNGGRLSGFAGASAFRQVSDGSNLGVGLSAKTFGWSARTNATFRVSKSFDLQTLLSYQAAMTVEQGRIASRTRLNLAARQKLMNDRLALTLRVIDPFNSSRESSTTIDPRFYQVSDRRRLIRGLLLSPNRAFGKPLTDHDPNEADPGAR